MDRQRMGLIYIYIFIGSKLDIYIVGWMDGQIDYRINIQMAKQKDRCIDGWIIVQVERLIDRKMDRYKDGFIGRQKMDRYKDEQLIRYINS